MMLPVPGSYFRLVPRCPPFINVPRNLKENSYFGMRKQILKLIGECEGAGLSCVRSFTADGLRISQTPLSIKFLVPSLRIHGHLYISQHYWKLHQN